ncbi:MAG: SDR family oxidoreductase [Cyanobacteria bacterium REEB67]|nr:SDR family oxidoreductase [Cyanobacteria bacterium REEB67]
MELGLRGKTALVSGASYGLGYHCARELAKEGVDIFICGRDQEKITSAANTIQRDTGVKTLGTSADLTKEKDLERLVLEAEAFLGHIDILIVNTGHPPTQPFSIASNDMWRQGMDMVLWPPIILSRLVLEGMKKRKYGRIIFIGSIFGLEPEQSSVVQSTLRTGLNALSKCIAAEAAPKGVTANVIAPGYFETPLVHEMAQRYATEAGVSQTEVLTEWKHSAPVQQFGKPEDLGALVTFLASPRAAFLTGTTLVMDGGALKQY